MSRRRFTTEQLEAMVVEERLARETKLSVVHEFGALFHRGVLLAACVFKRDDEKERRDVPLLTAEQVAYLTGISEKTVYRDTKSGKLKGTRYQFQTRPLPTRQTDVSR